MDFDRPPARLPPRTASWTRLVVGWGACAVLAVLTLALLRRPVAPVLGVLLLVATTISLLGMSYSQYRIRSDGLILARYLTLRGYPIDDPEGGARTADRLEIEAYRRYRRGTMSRADYERVVAHRRFAHGEITLAQYHELMAEIVDAEAVERVRDPTTASP